MVVEFSVIPIGSGTSISADVAEAIKIVAESGIKYKVTPMSTIMEGSWEEIMEVIRKCHEALLKRSGRVMTRISIDDRVGSSGNRMNEKIESIEKRLNIKINN